MRKKTKICTILLIGILVQSVQAADRLPVSSWDRVSAMAAVQSIDITSAVNSIGDLSSLADAESTLNGLRLVHARTDWPLPAREAVIYRFTQSLAALPREAVASEVMHYLGDFQPRVLVPHEDHGDAFVPLFNIRAAAAGVENRWKRTEATTTANMLLGKDPDGLIENYLQSTDRNLRFGYLDALQQAGPVKAGKVQSVALRHLADTPGLTPVLGATIEVTGDSNAIRELLIYGSGAGLSQVLRNIGQQLQTDEVASLLSMTVELAPASNAALAIAAWWPRLHHDPVSRDLLLRTLGDPVLGVAAALALAKSPDNLTIRMLQKTADSNSMAAHRARMALEVNRAQLLGEAQR